MKVNTLMIKKKVKVDSSGLMEENMRVAGEMESNMESEHTLLQAVKPSKESGKKEKDFTGYHQMTNDFHSLFLLSVVSEITLSNRYSKIRNNSAS